MQKIKGQCENCGCNFEGELTETGHGVICPVCKETTNNFDEAHIVDANDKDDGREIPTYTNYGILTVGND